MFLGIFSKPENREKIIKAMIFWVIVAGAIISFFVFPLEIKSQALGMSQTPSEYLAQDDLDKIEDPLDPCSELGGCWWRIGNYNQDTSRSSIEAFIFDVIYLLIFLAGAVAVLLLVYGAVLMVTSAGKEEQFKNGRNTVINAIIGLVLVILSFTIVNLVQTIIQNLRI